MTFLMGFKGIFFLAKLLFFYIFFFSYSFTTTISICSVWNFVFLLFCFDCPKVKQSLKKIERCLFIIGSNIPRQKIINKNKEKKIVNFFLHFPVFVSCWSCFILTILFKIKNSLLNMALYRPHNSLPSLPSLTFSLPLSLPLSHNFVTIHCSLIINCFTFVCYFFIVLPPSEIITMKHVHMLMRRSLGVTLSIPFHRSGCISL